MNPTPDTSDPTNQHDPKNEQPPLKTVTDQPHANKLSDVAPPTQADASALNTPIDSMIEAPCHPAQALPQQQVSAGSGSSSKADLHAISPPRPLKIKDLIQICHAPSKEEQTISIQSVPKIHKPSKQTFFRCLDDETKWSRVTVFIPEDEFNEYYFVAPNMASILENETRQVRLVPCITLERIPFFWPLNVSDCSNSWNDSALTIAGQATKTWIRMASDKKTKQYRSCTPKIPKPDPIWPDDNEIDRLLDMATEGRIIDSVDHPVIAKLF